MFRRLYIRWLVWRGKAVDIWSKSEYPADVLSNLCSNGFRFDGVVCGSMEGFLQSLKQKDKDKQRQVCSMKGKNAKKMTSTGWQTDQIVWWKGNPIDRQSQDFYCLVSAAYLIESVKKQQIFLELSTKKHIFAPHGVQKCANLALHKDKER